MATEIEKAYKRGYQRGYNAGRRKGQEDAQDAITRQRRDEKWNQAFLASLPVCINAQGWTRTVNGKDEPISSLKQRVRLAKDFADEAMRYMK